MKKTIKVTDDKDLLWRIWGTEYAEAHAGKTYVANIDNDGWAYPESISVKFPPSAYEEVK